MAAVQFDNGVEFLVAVSAPRADMPVRRRRLRLRRLYAVSRQDVTEVEPRQSEPEDHWDDGARASMAMVGVTYRS